LASPDGTIFPERLNTADKRLSPSQQSVSVGLTVVATKLQF